MMISIKNDATCINNKRGMARRAKRHSSHQLRQEEEKFLKEHEEEWREQNKSILEQIRESTIITSDDLTRRINESNI